MSVNVELNGSNRILSTHEFESHFGAKKGEAPAEGQHDFRPRVNTIFSIPNELVDELREMLAEYADDGGEFDDDGALETYNDDETIDKLLKQMFYVEKEPTTYNVTVEFTVEAMSAEEAEQKVAEEIGWGADYQITSVYED